MGVRLTACTRCKEVHYCSKPCKLKAWNTRHKDECVRVGGMYAELNIQEALSQLQPILTRILNPDANGGNLANTK